MKTCRSSIALLSVLALAGCGPDGATSSVLEPAAEGASFARGGNSGPDGAAALSAPTTNVLLAAARANTAQYQRVELALEAGYEADPFCIAIPTGGMGIHYVNQHLVDDVFDPAEPEALIYEPTSNGRLKLVAVEYLYAGENPPELEFHPTQVPGATWDYDMHAWVWRDNPDGVFAPFNPNVSCEFGVQPPA